MLCVVQWHCVIRQSSTQQQLVQCGVQAAGRERKKKNSESGELCRPLMRLPLPSESFQVAVAQLQQAEDAEMGEERGKGGFMSLSWVQNKWVLPPCLWILQPFTSLTYFCISLLLSWIFCSVFNYSELQRLRTTIISHNLWSQRESAAHDLCFVYCARFLKYCSVLKPSNSLTWRQDAVYFRSS